MKNYLLSLFLICGSIFGNSQIDHWETIVFEDDIWDYLVPTNTVDSQWKIPGFNTTSWNSGIGGFGYGDNDDNTVLPNGTIACFQRIEFSIADTSIIKSAALTVDFDDSFVAYLNGVEITRSTISGQNPSWNQPSDGLHEAEIYQGNYPSPIQLSNEFLSQNLIQGNNVLAIQTHNESNTSSDLTSRVYFHLGISSSNLVYTLSPNWFVPPFIFDQSNLPIVVINTVDEAAIPNDPKIDAIMGIIYNGEGNMNSTSDPFNEFYGAIGIEIRGSSSGGFAKKGYGVETRGPDSMNYNVSLFDWPADNDWVLHAPYSDKSLIRNVITYELARRMGRYAPRTKLCEVILNGQYQGVYVLVEKIKKSQGRVAVDGLDYDEVDDQSITGGYIVKIDKTTSGGIVAWSSPYMAASPSNAYIKYQLHDPEIDEINPLQLNYIENYITSFEDALSGPDFLDPNIGYRKYIDVGSFIDFMIMNEISKNVDGYRISTFYHKNHIKDGGKFVAGPLWDFNLGWGNANYCEGGLSSGWEIDFNSICGGTLVNPFHWQRFLDDPNFVHELNCRWQTLRQSVLHEDSLMAYIDGLALYLNDAADRNFQKWTILGSYIWPNNYIGNSYADEINYLKTWLQSRLLWMDENMYGDCFDLSLQNDFGIQEILVYPNPANDFVKLIFESKIQNGRVEIQNIFGQKVYHQMILNSSNHQIDIKDLNEGIYIISVFENGKIIAKEKLICQ